MKRQIQKMLPKSRIGKSVLVLMSGTMIAQAITAASMPIVTRLYTPEMIGVISVYLSFFNFWLTLLTWRYESALLITEDEEESHHVFRLGAILAFLTALLAIPVLGGLRYKGVLGFDVLPFWSPLVAFFSLLGFGWFMLYRSWLLRLREARVITLSAVARSGANAGTRLIAGCFSIGLYGLFLAEILGSWFALGAVRNKTKKLLSINVPIWNARKIKGVAIRYKKFAQYELPSALVNQLAIALPVPMIGALYGSEAAGWFGLARLLYAIPNGQIGRAVGDAFRMELGACLRENNIQKGSKLFFKLSGLLALVGVFPLLGAIFFAPSFIPYIFGESWSGMGEIIAAMSIWMYASLIVSSMSVTLSVLQRQELKMAYDAFSLFVVICVYFISREFDFSLLYFISILSFGMTLSYLLYYFLIVFALKDVLKNEH